MRNKVIFLDGMYVVRKGIKISEQSFDTFEEAKMMSDIDSELYIDPDDPFAYSTRIYDQYGNIASGISPLTFL